MKRNFWLVEFLYRYDVARWGHLKIMTMAGKSKQQQQALQDKKKGDDKKNNKKKSANTKKLEVVRSSRRQSKPCRVFSKAFVHEKHEDYFEAFLSQMCQ